MRMPPGAADVGVREDYELRDGASPSALERCAISAVLYWNSPFRPVLWRSAEWTFCCLAGGECRVFPACPAVTSFIRVGSSATMYWRCVACTAVAVGSWMGPFIAGIRPRVEITARRAHRPLPPIPPSHSRRTAPSLFSPPGLSRRHRRKDKIEPPETPGSFISECGRGLGERMRGDFQHPPGGEGSAL